MKERTHGSLIFKEFSGNFVINLVYSIRLCKPASALPISMRGEIAIQQWLDSHPPTHFYASLFIHSTVNRKASHNFKNLL